MEVTSAKYIHAVDDSRVAPSPRVNMDGLVIGQAEMFDEMRIPYTFDDDLGAMAAGHVAGRGDGRWVYDEHLVIVETRARPYLVVAKYRKRQERAEKALNFIMNWSLDDYLSGKNEGVEGVEDESGDEEAETPTVDTELGKIKHGNPPGASRRRATNGLADNDASLLSQCTVVRRPRCGNGRVDLSVTTPDGCIYRSYVAALRHMDTMAEKVA